MRPPPPPPKKKRDLLLQTNSQNMYTKRPTVADKRPEHVHPKRSTVAEKRPGHVLKDGFFRRYSWQTWNAGEVVLAWRGHSLRTICCYTLSSSLATVTWPHQWPGYLVGKSAGLVIERLQVRIPAGAAGKFSSSKLTSCADSYSVSVPSLCYRSGT